MQLLILQQTPDHWGRQNSDLLVIKDVVNAPNEYLRFPRISKENLGNNDKSRLKKPWMHFNLVTHCSPGTRSTQEHAFKEVRRKHKVLDSMDRTYLSLVLNPLSLIYYLC